MNLQYDPNFAKVGGEQSAIHTEMEMDSFFRNQSSTDMKTFPSQCIRIYVIFVGFCLLLLLVQIDAFPLAVKYNT